MASGAYYSVSTCRNDPVLGRIRFLFEAIRPEMRQSFVESDADGRPRPHDRCSHS